MLRCRETMVKTETRPGCGGQRRAMGETRAKRADQQAGDFAVWGRRAELAERLRAAGQRVTAQRLVILEALVPGLHLSADDIYARVAPLLPAVNRSTVYRTLELFRDLGLISET